MKTDYVDLWQLHNVRTQEDLDQIFGKDGAIYALVDEQPGLKSYIRRELNRYINGSFQTEQ